MAKPNSLVSIATSCKGFYQCAKWWVYLLFLLFSGKSNKLWEAAFSYKKQWWFVIFLTDCFKRWITTYVYEYFPKCTISQIMADWPATPGTTSTKKVRGACVWLRTLVCTHIPTRAPLPTLPVCRWSFALLTACVTLGGLPFFCISYFFLSAVQQDLGVAPILPWWFVFI